MATKTKAHTKDRLGICENAEGDIDLAFDEGAGDMACDFKGCDNADANAAEMKRRWNAFEEGGAVESLRASLQQCLEALEVQPSRSDGFSLPEARIHQEAKRKARLSLRQFAAD